MSDRLNELKAALKDRYEIEHELGRGGMATVYLANDLKHGRKVALKVLKPELAAVIGAERFLREIRITADLNHAHILPLLDSGSVEEQPPAGPPDRLSDLLYYVMPYVEGESLRDRLNRETWLPIADALDLASEVADALGSAHRHNVIHRDIKPENVLLREGHAVVADFGIALAVTAAHGDRLTEAGLSLGTPTYMSPEQIEGAAIDGRSDIYSLGCLLFEMTTGRPPFEGSTPLAVAVQHQVDAPPNPREVNEDISEDLAQLILRCLAKEPAERYQTATEVLAEIDRIRHPAVEVSGVFNLVALWRQLRRPVVALPTVLAVIALAWFSVWFFKRQAEVRWAREEAIPEIRRLIGENDVWRNLVVPYRLAERAEAILGYDPELEDLFSQVALKIDVITDPPAASVYMKEYGHPEAEWTYMGTSPLEKVRMPIGIFRWKLEKEGYETVLAAASSWDLGNAAGKPDSLSSYDLVRTLDEEGSAPPGMVWVQATETAVGTLGDFFIGRYEVTNREYKEFVDAGGYRTREYWKHPFVRDGREISWDTAMKEFVDPSDQPGPSTWMGGDYPQGQDEHPVSGVSWYEAAAYAEYAGMTLPSAAHWNVARGAFTPMIQWPQLGGFGILAPFTNFGGQGPVPVGSLPGITAYGAYDMAGNVREWCWNETPLGRVIRGGAWNDNTYEFGNLRQAPPMDRSARNGFRLAVYPDPETVSDAAFGFQRLGQRHDFRTDQPVSDAVFEVYREQFSYDATDLNARVEYRLESPGGWIREKVSFDAAYGGERVVAYLFLPANAAPPFQTVIYFPGGASRQMASSQDLESYYEFPMFLSFLVRSGRAVLYPVYKGTFERGDPALAAIRMGSYAYTEFVVQLIKDFRRSIDYLETRPDIDGGRLAYYGMSWGGHLGAIIPAVEDRLGASVLVAGGLWGWRARPEVSTLNYVTRVRTPTLMLNGRHDNLLDIDGQVKPMFDLLGTPAEDKRLIFYDTDHIPPRAESIMETLAWLDKYLGPVGR